jgi:signal transduction histidine kinase
MEGLSRLARGLGGSTPAESADANASAEVRKLAEELSMTSMRLEQSRQSEERLELARRELVAGISHDLRTPLAGIRAIAEALEDDMIGDREAMHDQMRVRVDQLSAMVDDLFELSKLNAGMLTLSLGDVSLYDLVSDAVADLGSLAASRSITVRAESPDALTVRADARELSRAISNLLMNAVQHTPLGTAITVIAGRSTDGRPSIGVMDQGGGIDEADLPRVFEAGWRGAKARPSLVGRTGGAGLGLAIVAGIVRAHNGETTVRNIPGGCLFEVLLPR